MTRRSDLLDELADLRSAASTPRIDSTRNRLDATTRLLETARSDLDVLHALAYERHTARREAVVAGGARDYALDTHGDPRARGAYKQLSLACHDTCDILAEAAHDAIALLREGDGHGRRRGGAALTAVDMAVALDAQARRAARGEFTPRSSVPQPGAAEAGSVTLESLAAENRRLQAENQELRSNRTGPKTKHGWRKTPRAV